MKNFNLTRKQIVIALGVVSALVYLAPFRQQVVNQNRCVAIWERIYDEQTSRSDYTDKRKAINKAEAYGRCA